MKVKIIERNSKSKNSDEILAKWMNISVEELRDIRRDIKNGREERRKRTEEYKKKNNGKELIIEYCCPTNEGKIMLLDNIKNSFRKALKYEEQQEQKHMRKKLKDFKIPYKSLVKRI